MEITIEELRKGDEILVTSGGRFKYLRLLREPAKNAKTGLWKSIQCLTKCEIVTHSYQGYGGKTYSYTRKKYKPEPPEEGDLKLYQQLRHCSCWLVKREEI